MVNYSIIIPHKNLPALLNRCLCSIPERDDVQILVVDDNSDPSVVNFDDFPGQGRAGLQLIFDKSGLGAGHARNLGLQQALGKWLIFADCDDFFETDELSRQMDSLINDDTSDLIYFDFFYINSETLMPSPKLHKLNNLFELMREKKDFNYLRYRWNAPWGKFIKQSLVKKNKISFQESRWSNDVGFSTDVAIAATSAKCIRSKIYNYTYRSDSLIKSKSLETFICRLETSIINENKLKMRGLAKYRSRHIEYWHYKLLSVSLIEYFRFVPKVIKVVGVKDYIRGVISNVKNSLVNEA